MAVEFDEVVSKIKGELYYSDSIEHAAIKKVYATDASVYQELPLAVCLPKVEEDIQALIQFAKANNLTLIPRAAGTSLAGQVVGNGIVVDISKHFTSVIEVNEQEKWVRVQPGVIRDELNVFLKHFGLMFGPETSTANRAMIGGMIGNNSCGLHSIIWGDTRANVLEIKGFLSDGSEIVFKDLTIEEYQSKLVLQTLEGDIYRLLQKLMQDSSNRQAIRKGFPKASIKRRNSGYALDFVLEMWEAGQTFNLSKLIAGSEGTLCFITEAKLKLLPLPAKEKGIVAVHTTTVKDALIANLIALEHACAASELVDDFILEFTKTNTEQSKNRFFVEGEPKAILMVEFFDNNPVQLTKRADAFINELQQRGLGYAYPFLIGDDSIKAWDLRKAGLGLLRNEPGDIQPVNLIEDCAVDVQDLPNYIEELGILLKQHGLKYSMYAHAGAGELHVEPMINLKTSEGKALFRHILAETAAIVKKYGGALSGEHGDGRLRGEFIPFIMGPRVYFLFKELKNGFDPSGIFNKGKIVDTPPMNEMLRYEQDVPAKKIATLFDFPEQQGILRLAEKCSGSGDCRKTHITGGTMCPSFMATRSEHDTTRARANMLRHFYTEVNNGGPQKGSDEEVLEVLDLCLSCKACKSECPSSVDVSKMKAEFTQSYYDKHGVPFRSRLIADFSKQMKFASLFPRAYNFIFKQPAIRGLINKAIGFHPDRTMPLLHKTTLRKWWAMHQKELRNAKLFPTGNTSVPASKKVYLFCDEFTNYNDVEVGQKAIRLLETLGYEVIIPEHKESGRTYLSKGLVRKAKAIAIENVLLLSKIIKEKVPIIGIEPSAILTLRDEYPELVPPELMNAAKQIASHSYLFEEWFSGEIAKGQIDQSQFAERKLNIFIHGHCYQKSLSSTSYIKKTLSVVPGHTVVEIPSGCCGMAGSFGYEKEHYEISMKIGGLVLFPAVNRLTDTEIIAASGTSCRHQIKDGTGKEAKHSAEILYDALKN